MNDDINSADQVYSNYDDSSVLHLDMKPKKAPPQLDYKFVKSFIDKGLYINGTNFTITEAEAKNGMMACYVTDKGHYAYFAVNDGQFEAWARNQGGYLAARKEGFTDEQLLKLNIYMGLPVWMELVSPEDVTKFLSMQAFCLYSPKRKVLLCDVADNRKSQENPDKGLDI